MFQARSLLASGSLDGSVRLWKWETGALVATLQSPSHAGPVLSLAVLHDRTLVSSSTDGTIAMWDVTVNALVKGPLIVRGLCLFVFAY
jgi:WD40 repeat protein